MSEFKINLMNPSSIIKCQCDNKINKTIVQIYPIIISLGRSKISLGIPRPTKNLLNLSENVLQLYENKLYLPGLKNRTIKIELHLH